MNKGGTVSVLLDHDLGTALLLQNVSTVLGKYEEAWKQKQDSVVLSHARLRFKFIGFRRSDKGLYADYTATVEKF